MQIGFAVITVSAAITTALAAPPPNFDPDFNKRKALYFAKL